MDYNTQLPNVKFREYGRNIQKLVDKAIEIEDPEKRKEVIDAIINMMAQLNPKLKNFEDFRHKLWDHMFIMS